MLKKDDDYPYQNVQYIYILRIMYPRMQWSQLHLPFPLDDPDVALILKGSCSHKIDVEIFGCR